MNIPLVLLVALIALSIRPGFAADKLNQDLVALPVDSPQRTKLRTVRVRFVPGSVPMKGGASYNGASWSALDQGPVKGELWLTAHAGIGDKFPVRNKEGAILFGITLAKGGDDHVVLEIRSTEGSRKINLPRDKAGAVKVAGIKYRLLYPAVCVAAAGDEKPAANKAMLIVSCSR